MRRDIKKREKSMGQCFLHASLTYIDLLKARMTLSNDTLQQDRRGHIEFSDRVERTILPPEYQYWFYGPNAKHEDRKVNVGTRGAIWSEPREPNIQCARVGSVVKPAARSEKIFRGLLWHHHSMKISCGLCEHTLMPHNCTKNYKKYNQIFWWISKKVRVWNIFPQ